MLQKITDITETNKQSLQQSETSDLLAPLDKRQLKAPSARATVGDAFCNAVSASVTSRIYRVDQLMQLGRIHEPTVAKSIEKRGRACDPNGNGNVRAGS